MTPRCGELRVHPHAQMDDAPHAPHGPGDSEACGAGSTQDTAQAGGFQLRSLLGSRAAPGGRRRRGVCPHSPAFPGLFCSPLADFIIYLFM